MTNKKIKTIFLGTPDFAIPGLKAILNDERFEVILIITQPDKKVGRSQELSPPPVKLMAQEYKIPVIQPHKITAIKEKISSLKPDLAVLIAYGQIISEEILNIPKFGFINVHASLLPKCRGAACIQGTILDGDKTTGVTIIKLDQGLDTGPILKQVEIKIEPEDTATSMHEKLAILSSQILGDALSDYVQGKITPKPQTQSGKSYVKTLKKEDGKINWLHSAIRIERQIRALNPWPGTFTSWQGKNLKILSVSNEILDINKHKIGKVFLHNNQPSIQTGNKALIINSLQLEGKKPVLAKDFIRGNKNFVGTILG